MTCNDCGKHIGHEEHLISTKAFGLPLCERHTKLIQKVIRENGTPIEAIKLFYALRESGANPMLEWWDGQKSIDIAISRVKLNIEIDTHDHMITDEQVLIDLDEGMYSFNNGFTTIRIPHTQVTTGLKQLVTSILRIIKDLKANTRVM